MYFFSNIFVQLKQETQVQPAANFPLLSLL